MSRVVTQPVLLAVFALATAIVRYYQALGLLDDEKTVTVNNSYEELQKLSHSMLCLYKDDINDSDDIHRLRKVLNIFYMHILKAC